MSKKKPQETPTTLKDRLVALLDRCHVDPNQGLVDQSWDSGSQESVTNEEDLTAVFSAMMVEQIPQPTVDAGLASTIASCFLEIDQTAQELGEILSNLRTPLMLTLTRDFLAWMAEVDRDGTWDRLLESWVDTHPHLLQLRCKADIRENVTEAMKGNSSVDPNTGRPVYSQEAGSLLQLVQFKLKDWGIETE